MGDRRLVRRESCTVTVELNRYGAMTLHSEQGRTYQVVTTEDPAINERLERLSVDDSATVTMRRAPGRGNTWRAIGVECDGDADRKTAPSGRPNGRVEP